MKKKNIIILTIILLIVLIAGAYGKAMTVIKGKGYFIIAKPICETEIEETSQTDSLGSYYNVKIKEKTKCFNSIGNNTNNDIILFYFCWSYSCNICIGCC